MSKVTETSREGQDRRQQLKHIGHQMKQVAVQGTGLSPWEAEVLVNAIEEVYFSDPSLREARDGQVKYQCVSSREGAGKPLQQCQMVPVWLTLFEDTDQGEFKSVADKGQCVELRRRRMMRICEEARDQGGLLSQEDLADLLMCNVRTIRRDIADLRCTEIQLPTRGQQKDIGPGVSHRELAIRHWLDGKDPVEVARHIKHSLAATENYLEKFKRVAFLREKKFTVHEIALTVGISVRASRTFSDLHDKNRNSPFYEDRLTEINLVGQQFYVAQDEKKETTLSVAIKNDRRRR